MVLAFLHSVCAVDCLQWPHDCHGQGSVTVSHTVGVAESRIFVHTKGGPRYSVYNASVSENQEVILKGMWCSS